MSEVKVDPDVFWLRIMKLHKTWNVRLPALPSACPLFALRAAGSDALHCSQSGREKEGLFKGADAIAVVTGSANEEELYSKSAALQTWLLGYEFPDTVIAICSRSITILTSPKKGVLLLRHARGGSCLPTCRAPLHSSIPAAADQR